MIKKMMPKAAVKFKNDETSRGVNRRWVAYISQTMLFIAMMEKVSKENPSTAPVVMILKS